MEGQSQASAGVETQAANSPNSAPEKSQANPEPPKQNEKAQEQAQQIQAAKKKYKLKVDGEEFEEEFDPSDDEAVRKELQLARAAKKRMTEAVSEKRKAFEIIKAFESDPESMLKRLGPKGREIAEKFLLSRIEEDMLSPQEKELRELKQKVETFEQKEAREKKEAEERANAEKEHKFAQSFQNTIIEALNKSGLPKTPDLVKRLASIMSKNLEYGLELTSDDLVAEVKTELTSILKAVIGDSDGDQLIGLFGKDVANKIRKADLKKLQERQSQVFQGGKKPADTAQTSTKSNGYMTMDEWKAQVDQRIKNLP